MTKLVVGIWAKKSLCVQYLYSHISILEEKAEQCSGAQSGWDCSAEREGKCLLSLQSKSRF